MRDTITTFTKTKEELFYIPKIKELEHILEKEIKKFEGKPLKELRSAIHNTIETWAEPLNIDCGFDKKVTINQKSRENQYHETASEKWEIVCHYHFYTILETDDITEWKKYEGGKPTTVNTEKIIENLHYHVDKIMQKYYRIKETIDNKEKYEKQFEEVIALTRKFMNQGFDENAILDMTNIPEKELTHLHYLIG